MAIRSAVSILILSAIIATVQYTTASLGGTVTDASGAPPANFELAVSAERAKCATITADR